MSRAEETTGDGSFLGERLRRRIQGLDPTLYVPPSQDGRYYHGPALPIILHYPEMWMSYVWSIGADLRELQRCRSSVYLELCEAWLEKRRMFVGLWRSWFERLRIQGRPMEPEEEVYDAWIAEEERGVAPLSQQADPVSAALV